MRLKHWLQFCYEPTRLFLLQCAVLLMKITNVQIIWLSVLVSSSRSTLTIVASRYECLYGSKLTNHPRLSAPRFLSLLPPSGPPLESHSLYQVSRLHHTVALCSACSYVPYQAAEPVSGLTVPACLKELRSPLCAKSGRSGYHDAVNLEDPADLLSSMLMIKSRGKIVSLVCMSSSIVHQR